MLGNLPLPLPMLDGLSVSTSSAGLISNALQQHQQATLSSSASVMSGFTGRLTAPSVLGAPLSDAAEAEAELAAFEAEARASGSGGGQMSFVKPIADLFLETFELNRGSSWLRGRAVVVVLHQLLGGTIEK